MSNNDFKDRLAMIIHGRPRINRHYGKAVVRQPTDRGYYPDRGATTALRGSMKNNKENK